MLYKKENRLWKWTKRIFILFLIWLLLISLVNLKIDNIDLKGFKETQYKLNDGILNELHSTQKEVSILREEVAQFQLQMEQQSLSIKEINDKQIVKPIAPSKNVKNKVEAKTTTVPKVVKKDSVFDLKAGFILIGELLKGVASVVRFVPVLTYYI